MPKSKKRGIFLACLLAAGGVFCWQNAEKAPDAWVLREAETAREAVPRGQIPPAEAEGPESGEEAFSSAAEPEGAEQAEEPSWIYASEPLKVNINTADQAELDKLPGIGPAKAAAIIAYREAYGPFLSPEELMLVPGIKEATFGKLKDHVLAP